MKWMKKKRVIEKEENNGDKILVVKKIEIKENAEKSKIQKKGWGLHEARYK